MNGMDLDARNKQMNSSETVVSNMESWQAS